MRRDLAKATVVTVMYVVVSWQCMNSFFALPAAQQMRNSREGYPFSLRHRLAYSICILDQESYVY